MKRKLILSLIALALLTPWPVAYAYEDAAGQSPVQITAAEAEASPSYQAYAHAIGGIEPGDLFYIDATSSVTNLEVQLNITNTNELIHNYRYLTLKVGVYVDNGTDQWEKVTTAGAQPFPDFYVTMQNGGCHFELPGYARYKLTLDGGCFNCYPANETVDATTPEFYLTVDTLGKTINS